MIQQSSLDLKNEKLQDIIKKQNKNGDSNILKEVDQNNFRILTISIADQFNSVCDQKLIAAKQYVKTLSSSNHPNIAKYIDHYQVDTSYFIVIEKYDSTLSDFLQNNHQTINQQQYIEIALQMLHTIQYLHNNNYYLRYFSLNDILIDNKNQIKLYDFYSAENTSGEEIQKLFEQKQNDKNFFFPPEIFKSPNHEKCDENDFQRGEGDIWLFGICMYILAGASLQDAEQLTRGISSFKIQKSISLEINQILLDILIRNPKSRLSIDFVIEKFRNIQVKKDIYSEKKLFEYVEQCFDYFDFKTSIPYLQKLIEKNPLNDQYIAMLGRGYLEIGFIDQAIEQSFKSLQINPLNDLSMSNLGFCEYRMNNLQKASEYIDKCLSINPNNYIALNYKGYLMKQKNNEESFKIFQKVLEINPNYLHAINAIGEIYNIKGNFDQALYFYQQSLSIKLNFIYGYVFQARVYRDQNMYDLVLENLQKAEEIDPKNSFLLDEFGDYYKQQGQYGQAIGYYTKALQVNPKQFNSLQSLGDIFLNKNEYNSALNYYKKFLNIRPNSSYVLHAIGYIYDKKHEKSKALIYYKKALKINPFSKITNHNIAYIYNAQQKYDLSQDFYKKELNLNPNNQQTISNLQKVKKVI